MAMFQVVEYSEDGTERVIAEVQDDLAEVYARDMDQSSRWIRIGYKAWSNGTTRALIRQVSGGQGRQHD